MPDHFDLALIFRFGNASYQLPRALWTTAPIAPKIIKAPQNTIPKVSIISLLAKLVKLVLHVSASSAQERNLLASGQTKWPLSMASIKPEYITAVNYFFTLSEKIYRKEYKTIYQKNTRFSADRDMSSIIHHAHTRKTHHATPYHRLWKPETRIYLFLRTKSHPPLRKTRRHENNRKKGEMEAGDGIEPTSTALQAAA